MFRVRLRAKVRKVVAVRHEVVVILVERVHPGDNRRIVRDTLENRVLRQASTGAVAEGVTLHAVVVLGVREAERLLTERYLVGHHLVVAGHGVAVAGDFLAVERVLVEDGRVGGDEADGLTRRLTYHAL